MILAAGQLILWCQARSVSRHFKSVTTALGSQIVKHNSCTPDKDFVIMSVLGVRLGNSKTITICLCSSLHVLGL